MQHQLALFQTYHNFVLPHASLRQPLLLPEPTNGSGSAKRWRRDSPTMCGRCKKCCSIASRRGHNLLRCKALARRIIVIQGKTGVLAIRSAGVHEALNTRCAW